MLQTVRLCLLKMPVTRSSTRSVSNNVSATKRKADDLNALSKTSQKKPRMVRAVSSSPPAPLPQVSSSSQLGGTDGSTAVLVSASLTFSFEKAKEHLIGVDHRFEDIFNKMTCRPFQQLERVHPFRYSFLQFLVKNSTEVTAPARLLRLSCKACAPPSHYLVMTSRHTGANRFLGWQLVLSATNSSSCMTRPSPKNPQILRSYILFLDQT